MTDVTMNILFCKYKKWQFHLHKNPETNVSDHPYWLIHRLPAYFSPKTVAQQWDTNSIIKIEIVFLLYLILYFTFSMCVCGAGGALAVRTV